MRTTILLTVSAAAVATAQITIPGVDEILSDVVPTGLASSIISDLSSDLLPSGFPTFACVTSDNFQSCIASVTASSCTANTAVPTGGEDVESRASQCACEASSSYAGCYSSHCSGATIPNGLFGASCTAGPTTTSSGTGSSTNTSGGSRTTTTGTATAAGNTALSTSNNTGAAPYLVPAEGGLLAALVGLLAFFM